MKQNRLISKAVHLQKMLLMLCLSLFPMAWTAYAQSNQAVTYVISGTVVDNEGLGVPGATVMVKGTTNGVVTDIDGKFQMTLTGNTDLECACLGYDNVVMSVTPKMSNIVITIKPSSEFLDEVVVVGYGTMRRSLVTSAISKVGVDENNMRTVASPTELLNGRVAGVTTLTGSGNLG